MVRKIWLDTDTGVDDALAICLAIRSPELRVEGITAVHGNIPARCAVANILRTLDVLCPVERPRVAVGAEGPLIRQAISAEDVHGADGLGGATTLRNERGRLRYPESTYAPDERDAVTLIRDCVATMPDELTFVAVGPLTNLALAIRLDPDGMRRLAGIVLMGGAFRRHGNVSPVTEFNVGADPHAASIVLESGIPVTMIPLDVTERVVLTPERIARNQDTRTGRFVADITRHTIAFGRDVENIHGMYVHDALTIGFLIDPACFRLLERRVAVETAGTLTTGQTIADLREPPRFEERPNARIAVDVDAEAFLELFEARVLAV